MKVFDLQCEAGHGFEGWFGSEEDYQSQCARGLLTCPLCGSAEVVSCIGIIPRQRLVFVLIAIDKERDRLEIADVVLDLGAVDQFLSLQHAAQQQADDDEDDCNFNQREAGLALAGATQ